MANTHVLFQPLTAGDVALPNRIVMAPMTRNRAQPDGTPQDMAITYYRQRAGAGLIVTEATQVSQEGQGYILTPGIYTDAHVAGWRKVTDAVHAAGGRIFVQLWHVGRISHTSLQLNGAAPVAPSAIRANAQTFAAEGFVDVSEPRALSTEEVARVVEDFRRAAEHAKAAGFDGAEIHGANGYLVDQFIRDGSNQRDDRYGGSIENRIRFAVELVDAVASVFGAGRTALRISPYGGYNDMTDSTPEETFGALYRALDGKGLSYLHVVEAMGPVTDEQRAALARMRGLWSGVYIANGGYTPERAAEDVAAGRAAAVSFGQPYIANPDLAQRIRLGAPLAEGDKSKYYGGGAEGYIDYPELARAA